MPEADRDVVEQLDVAMTPEEARAALEANALQRMRAAAAAIDAALKEHGCAISVRPVITEDGRVAAAYRIVAV